jgi:hypothetical protein
VDGRLFELMSKQFRLILFALIFLVPPGAQAHVSGAQAPPPGTQSPLRVAAAADLEPVLPPILAQFEHVTGIHA